MQNIAFNKGFPSEQKSSFSSFLPKLLNALSFAFSYHDLLFDFII